MVTMDPREVALLVLDRHRSEEVADPNYWSDCFLCGAPWPCDASLLARFLIDALDREARVRAIVDEQAEDDGLWCITDSIVEAYCQQELRRLHAAIEAS